MSDSHDDAEMTNSGMRAIALSFALTVISFGTAMGLPIPISSSLNLYAGANANAPENGNAGIVEDISNQPQGGTTNSLTSSVSASSAAGSAAVLVNGVASAQWTDSAHGTVNFSNLGWDTVNVSNGIADLDQLNAGFHYKFSATDTGSLNVTYSVTASASPRTVFPWENFVGLNGFVFYFCELQLVGNPLFCETHPIGGFPALDPAGNGTIVESLIAGQIYSFDILVGSNLRGPLGTRSAHQSAVFDFAILSTVPEPSSLALLLTAFASFGLLRTGASIKCRRHNQRFKCFQLNEHDAGLGLVKDPWCRLAIACGHP